MYGDLNLKEVGELVMKKFFNKCGDLPVGVLATAVAIATLSNIYLAVGGFVWVRHISMFAGMMVWGVALIKMLHPESTFKAEYRTVIPSSLYGTFSMLTMILGSYLFDFNAGLGRGVWLLGIVLHILHILVFTYRFVIKGIDKETFIPSWFVTYVGLLVAAVVGVPMGMPGLLTAIVYYGFAIMFVLLPLMIYRLRKNPLSTATELTTMILVAPNSLCLIGYLNISQNPTPWIVYGWYFLILMKLVYLGIKLPNYLNRPFNPGFASLTFPLAISSLASLRMSGFLFSQDMEVLGGMVRELFGIQLYITTAVIGYVVFNFLKLGKKALAK